MNNSGFEKNIENMTKYRNIKLVEKERGRKYVVLEPNYQTAKLFTEILLAVEIRKIQVLMNKPIYLDL